MDEVTPPIGYNVEKQFDCEKDGKGGISELQDMPQVRLCAIIRIETGEVLGLRSVDGEVLRKQKHTDNS